MRLMLLVSATRNVWRQRLELQSRLAFTLQQETAARRKAERVTVSHTHTHAHTHTYTLGRGPGSVAPWRHRRSLQNPETSSRKELTAGNTHTHTLSLTHTQTHTTYRPSCVSVTITARRVTNPTLTADTHTHIHTQIHTWGCFLGCSRTF